ncbi:hypothetical protein NP234_24260 [Salmonella enterica]|nr:hypothetical protein [Salmonella enterica]
MKNIKISKKVNIIAADNEVSGWKTMGFFKSFRRAAIKEAAWATSDRIADEVLDGIFLNLNGRNADKSAAEQRKLLRRIVEKRQAQTIHAKMGRGEGREAASIVSYNASHCLERLHRLRHAC